MSSRIEERQQNLYSIRTKRDRKFVISFDYDVPLTASDVDIKQLETKMPEIGVKINLAAFWCLYSKESDLSTFSYCRINACINELYKAAHGAPVEHPTLFGVLRFYLGTNRKLMTLAIFSYYRWDKSIWSSYVATLSKSADRRQNDNYSNFSPLR